MKRTRLVAALIPACLALGALSASASTASIRGLSIEYETLRKAPNSNVYNLSGGVSISLPNSSLKADRVDYDTKTGVLTAQGSPRLTAQGTSVSAGVIRLETARDKAGKLSLARGVASNGVNVNAVIPAKTGSGGNLKASAQNAVVEQVGRVVTLQGDAHVTVSDPDASLTASSIRCLIPESREEGVQCDAEGGVVVHARREAKAGEGATILDGKSNRATMKRVNGQDVVSLVGDVSLRTTDPANPGQADTMTGGSVNYNLSTGEIMSSRSPERQAEVTIYPKEKAKSEPRQK